MESHGVPWSPVESCGVPRSPGVPESAVSPLYRTVLSPTAIDEITEKTGLHVLTSDITTPSLNLLDRQWKSEIIRSAQFLEEVNEKVAIHAMRDIVISTLEILKLENKKSSTMNVWTGVFSITSYIITFNCTMYN